MERHKTRRHDVLKTMPMLMPMVMVMPIPTPTTDTTGKTTGKISCNIDGITQHIDAD